MGNSKLEFQTSNPVSFFIVSSLFVFRKLFIFEFIKYVEFCQIVLIFTQKYLPLASFSFLMTVSQIFCVFWMLLQSMQYYIRLENSLKDMASTLKNLKTMRYHIY